MSSLFLWRCIVALFCGLGLRPLFNGPLFNKARKSSLRFHYFSAEHPSGEKLWDLCVLRNLWAPCDRIPGPSELEAELVPKLLTRFMTLSWQILCSKCHKPSHFLRG